MGRFFRGTIKFGMGSFKRTFKLLYLRLNLGPYNKLDEEIKDFRDL
jgi:hypothetical protein